MSKNQNLGTFPVASRRMLVPYCVLGVTVFLTLIATYSAHLNSRAKEKAQFDIAVERSRETLQRRIGEYLILLDGLRGLVNAKLSVDRTQFLAYIEPLQLRKNYPGVQGLGFITRVPRERKAALSEKMRSQGETSFHIWPESEAAEVYPVTYLSPLDEHNARAVGFDMFSEPVSRTAMNRAVEGGEPTATSKFNFPGDGHAQNEPEFLLYSPVYWYGAIPATVEERRRLLFGFFYCAFHAKDFFNALSEGQIRQGISFQVYDGVPIAKDHLLHESEPLLGNAPQFTSTRSVTVGDRVWQVVFTTKERFIASSDLTPLIFSCGLAISLLVFGLTHAQSKARTAAERHAEQQLLSEAKFRHLVERSLVGVYIIQDEKFVYVNPTMAEMFGYSEKEMTSSPLLNFIFEEDRSVVGENVRKRLQGEVESVHYTLRGVRKNGSVLYAEAYGSRIDYNGRIAIQGMLLDITERKRAESRVAALSHLGQRLNLAKSAKEAGAIIVDIADQLFGWDACTLDLYSSENDRMSHVLNADTVDGKRTNVPPVYVNTSPSSLARRAIEKGAQLVLRENPDSDLEGIRFGDTSRPSASIMLVPIRYGNKVVGVLSIHSYKTKAYDVQDLDALQSLADHCGGALDRIQSAEALRVSEEHFRSVWERSLDGMRLTDGAGKILAVNEAFCRLVELPREKLLSHTFSVPYKEPLSSTTYQNHFEREDFPARTTTRVCLQNGKELELEITNSFIKLGERDQTKMLLSIFRDITERRMLEAQLRQSQKMEAIGQLAGGVAHDFNNLLAVIQGNAELAVLGGINEKTPDHIREITTASERAANLTRQLLTFGRKQLMQSQPLNLNDVIANLTKMLHRIIGENIELQCAYDSRLVPVQADLGMLEQIIVNLVVNARDAMPKGGQLLLSTEKVSLDEAYAKTHSEARIGDFICLRISDTGTGIPAEHLPHIFEPFYTTKDAGKGTGLGLATVHGIIKQHQGWVEVSTRLNAGTAFKVFLPAVAVPMPTKAASQKATSLQGGTETILLVEDDHSLRLLTRRVLERVGYRVLEATMGKQALEIWTAHAEEISLLLTDIVMPDRVTGFELAAEIRKQKPHLKVIFMSGYSADVAGKDIDFIRSMQSHFLQKPCSPALLLKTIRQCLDEE